MIVFNTLNPSEIVFNLDTEPVGRSVYVMGTELTKNLYFNAYKHISVSTSNPFDVMYNTLIT